MHQVTRQDVRSITISHQARRNGRAGVLTAVDSALYVACTAVAIGQAPLWLRLLASTAAGVVIARLFILGHDACHGSLFSSRRANDVIGRWLFLPSLTSFSLWEAGHNIAHHGYTNLKGRDHVWVPLAKDEYDALSHVRRVLERLYRSPLGLGAYYLVELWWKKLFFPSRHHVAARRREHRRDCWLVTAYAVTLLALAATAAAQHGGNITASLALGVFWPFAVWNMLMGFVIYVQHTHPDIGWFDNRREWTWFHAQVGSTPHVVFPLPFSALLHNIMEHTVHHLDVNVPLYQLPRAQDALEARFEDDVRVYPWSWRSFVHTTRTCRLYDYRGHRWLDFDGTVTAVVPRPDTDRDGDALEPAS